MTLPPQLMTLQHIVDPYSYYNHLRLRDPVHWNPSAQLWTLTRYADVVAGLECPRLSSQRPQPNLSHFGEEMRQAACSVYDALLPWLLRSDPPVHTRLRELVSRVFTPRLVESRRPGVQRIVDRLLDTVTPCGQMDFIGDFAAPLALSVIADLIGIPQQDHSQFQQWCHELSQLTEHEPEPRRIAQAHASLCSVRDYFADLLDSRRRQDNDDLLSGFLRAEVRGDHLSEAEILAMSALLLLAGHDTITHLLANGVLALLQSPGQCKLVKETPSLIEPAVQELLRYDSPLQGLLRIATHDIEFGAKRIERGQKVLLWLGAANRDLAQFHEPDRLDVARKMNRHVAFGFGIHRCVGAPLGLLTVETAIRTLLTRAPRLRLATQFVAWEGNLLFRNQQSLPVLF